MKEKEAQEVITKLNVHATTEEAANTYHLGIARGYLEAMEKVNGLVEVLEECTKFGGGIGFEKTANAFIKCIANDSKEALVQWEKDK